MENPGFPCFQKAGSTFSDPSYRLFCSLRFSHFLKFSTPVFPKSLKMAGRDRRVIEEDLANVEFETSEDVDVVPTFDSMKLREDLLRGVYAYGKKKPAKRKTT